MLRVAAGLRRVSRRTDGLTALSNDVISRIDSAVNAIECHLVSRLARPLRPAPFALGTGAVQELKAMPFMTVNLQGVAPMGPGGMWPIGRVGGRPMREALQ